MPMSYSTEFKIKMICRYENGKSIKAFCQKFDISQSTLYHWRKQYYTIQIATRSYTYAEFGAITKHLKSGTHVQDHPPIGFSH